jgi:tetratricopeptide (TPR) repeat protein
MSECTDTNLGRLIAQYELRMLSAEQAASFVEHAMECDYCLSQLEQMAPIFHVVLNSRAEIAAGLLCRGISLATLLPNDEGKTSLTQKAKQATGLSDRMIQWLNHLAKPRIFVPAFAVVALLFLWWPNAFHAPNPYLASLSFEKLDYDPDQMRASAETSEWFDRGMEAYQQNDFAEAVKDLRKAVKQIPNDGAAWMFLGISCYLNHQPSQAIATLLRADSLATGYPQSQIRLYLAQAFLLDNQPHKATPLLEGIVSQNLGDVERAKSLLTKVRSVEK